MPTELSLYARNCDKCLQHSILFNLHMILLGRYFCSDYTSNKTMLGEMHFVVVYQTRNAKIIVQFSITSFFSGICES